MVGPAQFSALTFEGAYSLRDKPSIIKAANDRVFFNSKCWHPKSVIHIVGRNSEFGDSVFNQDDGFLLIRHCIPTNGELLSLIFIIPGELASAPLQRRIELHVRDAQGQR